ncbi:hypothetical protein EDD25_1128 [Cryobacterium psychrophilum]|nr:hypothetical protein EDD25_1128 [Cryobacterium psychrophilum]
MTASRADRAAAAIPLHSEVPRYPPICCDAFTSDRSGAPKRKSGIQETATKTALGAEALRLVRFTVPLFWWIDRHGDFTRNV